MAHPSLIPVASSAIEAIRSVPATRGMHFLVVEFTSGRIYRYEVTQGELDAFNAAPSKGTYINQLRKTHTGIEMPVDDVSKFFASRSGNGSTRKTKPRSKLSWEQAFKLYPDLAYFF